MSSRALIAWIDQVFDHAVTEPHWYLAESTARRRVSATTARNIAETFESAGELLGRFSNQQLEQGFWYLFYPGPPDFMESLLEATIPLDVRLRALRSFVPLFEQVMAARCSSRLSHLLKKDGMALNCACYMWFDCVLDRIRPYRLAEAGLEQELPRVLKKILSLPHDACRESALHGIGHWVSEYPKWASRIDAFLAETPELRPELIAYAQAARAGRVL